MADKISEVRVNEKVTRICVATLDREGMLALLRLRWPEIPDDAEIAVKVAGVILSVNEHASMSVRWEISEQRVVSPPESASNEIVHPVFKTKLWVQEWEESERSWGTRPDGYTLHLERGDVDDYVKDVREREQCGRPEGYVPCEYSRPRGEPYAWETEDAELVLKVRAAKHGCRGSGPQPPRRMS